MFDKGLFTVLKKLYSVTECAELLGSTYGYVKTLIKKKEIGYVHIGKLYKVPAEELNRFVIAHLPVTQYYTCTGIAHIFGMSRGEVVDLVKNYLPHIVLPNSKSFFFGVRVKASDLYDYILNKESVPDKYFSVAQIADKFNFRIEEVEKLLNKGILTYYTVGGRKLVRESDLNEFLQIKKTEKTMYSFVEIMTHLHLSRKKLVSLLKESGLMPLETSEYNLFFIPVEKYEQWIDELTVKSKHCIDNEQGESNDDDDEIE